MKNILQERAQEYEKLHGRCRFSCDFVDKEALSGKAVLDIGCGFGWFDLFALRHSPARVVGIEPVAGDLEAARLSVVDPRVAYQENSALNLSFEAESFDTLVCWDVIEHIPKGTEPLFFKEVFRVLRPSGTLYLSTPFRSFRATATDPAWWLIGHRHYNVARLRALAGAAGLEVVHTTVRGGWREMLDLWNLYICKWIFRREPACQHFFQRTVDAEYQRDGFMTLFLKIRKPQR